MAKLDLNAFLIVEEHTPPSAISPESAPRVDLYTWNGSTLDSLAEDEHELLEAAEPHDVVVALSRHPSSAPPWQRFISDALSVPFMHSGESLGAIIFCAVQAGETVRWIGWSFGSGSRLLVRNAVEPRFGLVIALNALVVPDPESGAAAQLRHLSYRTTEPYFQQTGHRAARDIPVSGFRVDRQSDLVSAAGGRSADVTLGDVLGGRSIRFRSDVLAVDDFVAHSDYLISRFAETTYRTEFAWVDNIRPVFDVAAKTALREEVIGMLLEEPPPASIDAILPDDLVGWEDERAIHFVAFPREPTRTASATTLPVEGVARYVRLSDDPEAALSQSLRFLDEDRNLLGSASILECLCADLELGGDRYILYDGNYYEVDPAFVDQINEELDELPESEIELPCYGGGNEDIYNASGSADFPDRLVLLDRTFLRLPGESSVEPCDLLDINGALIHVKRKGSAASLSHLGNQATTSSELLRRMPEARDQLEELVKVAAPKSTRKASVALVRSLGQRRDVEVAFALLGDWRNRSRRTLPLLARVSLIHAARRIRSIGFVPTIKLVPDCA